MGTGHWAEKEGRESAWAVGGSSGPCVLGKDPAVVVGRVLLYAAASSSLSASIPAEPAGCVSWTIPGDAALHLELCPAQSSSTLEVLRSSPIFWGEPALAASRHWQEFWDSHQGNDASEAANEIHPCVLSLREYT